MSTMEKPTNKREGMSINEAMVIISATEHMTNQLGGNDTETSQFNALRAKLESGNIKPSEAVAEAEQILNSKNSNYH